MKKYLILISFAVFTALGFVACSDDTPIDNTPLPSDVHLSTESVFNEINFARQHPKAYIQAIQEYADANSKEWWWDNSDNFEIKNAIEYLENQPERQPYIFSRSLSLAAFDHCKDMNDKNFTGHTGSDGSGLSDRILRYASNWSNKCGEIIAYDSKVARDAVIDWILDSGLPPASKGHRFAIFDDDFIYVGPCFYKHPEWNVSVTVDFTAKGFKPNLENDNQMIEYYKP
jgi:hypothetical protein